MPLARPLLFRLGLFVALLVGAGCGMGRSQVAGPIGVRAAEAEDAAVLALRYQVDVLADTLDVELPADVVRELGEALARVRVSAWADSVDGIRAAADPSVRALVVGVDAGAGWAAAWADGDARTGHPPIDSLVTGYGLALERYTPAVSAAAGGTAVLMAAEPLNTVALGHRFERAAGVAYAGPDGVFGAPDDVEAERADGGWRLDFRRGQGDCFSGCIDRRVWSFLVTDGEVRFLGVEDR